MYVLSCLQRRPRKVITPHILVKEMEPKLEVSVALAREKGY